jgi:hypothetical protein
VNLEKRVSNLSFQSFYVSKEYSNCPLIPDLIGFIKKIDGINDLSISHKYGKRVLINSKNIDFKKIGKNNFLELVDYDPFKKILIVMGCEETCTESPLHWFIHHSRDDINAILLVKDIKYFGKKVNKIPIIDNKYPIWSIEQIKEVLGALRNSKLVIIKDVGVLFAGNSLKEIEKQFSKYGEDLK